MKKPSIIYILIVCCIVFVFTNTYLVFNYISKTDHQIKQIKKVSLSVEHANLLLSAIKDAEISQRGFLLTQDNIYLKPYLTAKNNIVTMKQFFFIETATLNFLSKASLNQLDSLIGRKLVEIDLTIGLVKNNKIQQATDIIKTNQGKWLMDRIRLILRSSIKLTEKHIISLENILEEKRRELKYFIYVFNFLIISTLIAFTLRLKNRDKKIANLLKSVTQQKNEVNLLAHDLQEQNEKLLKYSHILSHDLRAPIQNFKALMDIYEEEDDVKEGQTIFNMLRNQCNDLVAKIHQLIDELKLIQYHKEDKKNYSVRLLIEKVLTQFQQQIYTTKTKILLDIDHDLLLNGTGTYLESIIQNLISNALKYRVINSESFVKITALHQKEKIKITVEDNGLGIDLKKHGEDLFQIYKTFHHHPDGKGVGLHLVKKLVTNLKGEIEVESEVNKGTKFTITLPKS